MTKLLKIHGWRATGYLAQCFAIIAAMTAKGIGFTLQAIHFTCVRSLVKIAKWFAMTSAESHINAALLDYSPKTYR